MTTFDTRNPNAPTIPKDVGAVLDYTWDWSAWLGVDTVSTYQVTGDSTLIISNVNHAAGKVTAFIGGGGGDPEGIVRRATCKVVTAGGRTDYRSIYLRIVQR